jgi:ABC-2 type transport system ATP-binding protein
MFHRMAAMVQVIDLVKNYGNIPAVCNVSLDVAAGEIFGLLGPNGAGKTTTLECILGLRTPDGGSVTIDGIDAIRQPESVKRIIGAQLQATALQDKLTPREALRFFGAFYRNAIQPGQLIERFGLTEKADEPFDRLSTGQKQRLALALAFVNDPKLIFLDEPTAGLDPQSRRDLHEDILRLKTEGRTVVLSTHYIEEAQKLCDRVAVISAGRIIAAGTPRQLMDAEASSRKVLVQTAPELPEEKLRRLPTAGAIQRTDEGWHIAGSDITALVIALTQLVAAEGSTLIDLRIERASLEDVILQMMRPRANQ